MVSDPGLRVVLIHPAVPAEGVFQKLGRSDIPPLGILYLASSLIRAGHTVSVYDLSLEGEAEGLVGRVRGDRPQVVGLGTLAPAFSSTEALARELRAALPRQTRLIAGGPDVTCRSALYAASGLFDALFIGEAEETLPELCAAWPEVPEIHGVLPAGRANGRPARRIAPDEAPWPARHLVPIRRYRGGPAYKRGRRSTSVFTHRGCPYRCTFCEKGVHADGVRYRSPQGLFEEIQAVMRDFGVQDFRFVDDLLMANARFLDEFLEFVLRSGLRFDWMCCGRANLARKETLRKMRRAGCYRIEYGIESGSDRILELVKKGFDPARAAEALRITRRAGIETIANFILGFPTETEEEMRQTIEFAVRLNPDYALFFLFAPFSGAEISRQFDLSWDPHAPGYRAPSPAYLVPTGRVLELIQLAYRRFYFRPRFALRRLAAIRNVWIYWDLLRMARALVVDRLG